MNYRLIRTSTFSLGGVLSLLFDFNSRNDDEDNAVSLPIFSPRIGLQSEIMISPKLDIVLRAEYALASINLGGWTYSNEDDDSSNIAANWDDRLALNLKLIIAVEWYLRLEFECWFLSDWI